MTRAVVPPPSFVVLAAAAAVAVAAHAAEPTRLAPWPADAASVPAPWRPAGLPNQKKPFTAFSVVTQDGRRALRIEADSSYGNLLHPLRVEMTSAPRTLSWRWQVERLNEQADLHRKGGDDTTVKLCALFDLLLDKVPFIERQKLNLARSMTSDPVPTASVCYVWDSRLPAGTELPSPFTDRLRYLVLQSGGARAGQWVAEKRDLGADFLRLFGKESGGEVPALIGVAVGADADNTKQRSVAYVADLVLEP